MSPISRHQCGTPIFLSRKVEGTVEQEFEHSQKTFVPDKELRPMVAKIARELYGVESVRELDVNARLRLARKLRYEFASTIKQISRMVHLDKAALEGFL